MQTLSHQQAFVAEIKSKKWILKGGNLQLVPNIETNEF